MGIFQEFSITVFFTKNISDQKTTNRYEYSVQTFGLFFLKLNDFSNTNTILTLCER